MSIKYKKIDIGTKAHEYTPALTKLMHHVRANNQAPYLYPDTPEFYETILNEETLKIFAFDEHDLIGFSAMRILYETPGYLKPHNDVTTILEPHIGKCGYIWHLSVHPDARGQGISTQFLTKQIDEGKTMNCSSFIATAHPDNIASIKCFKRLNFTTLKTTKLYQYDLLRSVMWLDLLHS